MVTCGCIFYCNEYFDMDILSTPLKAICVMSLSFGLFACGGDKPETANNQQSNEPATPSGKTITVAVTSDYAPFTFMDERGGMIGFDVDVITTIGKQKGFNVQFKPVDFDVMFTEIERGAVDVAISSIFYTDDRNAKYGLTTPYHQGKPVYYYRADNIKLNGLTLTTLEDLNNKGLNLGGTAGTKHIERIQSVHGSSGTSAFKSDFESFTKVLRKEVDVALTDDGILAYTTKLHDIKGEHALNSVAYMGEQGYVMVLKKDNTALLETLNDGINTLIQNGEIKAFETKWFGQ